MPNQQLTEYITQSIAQGASKEEIKSSLLGAGWKEHDVNEGLLTVFPVFAQRSAPGGKSKALIITVSVLAALLLAGGGFAYWYFVYGANKQTVSEKELTIEYFRSLPKLETLKMETVLTQNTWSKRLGSGSFSEIFIYKFNKDGTYTNSYHSDYSTSVDGKWSIRMDEKEDLHLVLQEAGRDNCYLLPCDIIIKYDQLNDRILVAGSAVVGVQELAH